ncbi:MAG: HEAT repeat domain-containing protein, partial [Gammaproteobacteria bacterium]|nr:HEAT repeat domain-containing protein [Gammaproteobacteria bacterium]MBU1529202.1 HEAT repeat domain-containing protein [Gammaproteobacteria bacterium]
MNIGIPTLQERLNSPDAEVRRLAVIDLPYSDEDDIELLLLPCLQDADANVRLEAVRALEGFEDQTTVTALAQMLLDKSPVVQEAAGLALAELNESESAPPL